MAMVTVGTAQNARLTVRPNGNESYFDILQARSGYTMIAKWWDDDGIDGSVGLGGSGGLLGYRNLSNGDWNSTFVLEIIGSTITLTHGGGVVFQVTNTAYPNAGVWAYDDTYVDLVSFENLDTPSSGYTVDISASSGGSLSPAQLTDVDDTTGKEFTATPNAGYRIASITPSTGITVTPAASGQPTATTFTVKATQAGSVAVAFELIPAQPHNHNALMMGAGF